MIDALISGGMESCQEGLRVADVLLEVLIYFKQYYPLLLLDQVNPYLMRVARNNTPENDPTLCIPRALKFFVYTFSTLKQGLPISIFLTHFTRRRTRRRRHNYLMIYGRSGCCSFRRI